MHKAYKMEIRGVALLLALGILSLMLMLAMSFSFTARTERMASENSANLVKARLLSSSGFERALAYLKFTYDNTTVPEDYYPASCPGKLFSEAGASSGIGSHTAWVGRSYAVSRRATNPDQVGLGQGLATDLGFPFVPSRTDSELGSASELGATASWLHVVDDKGQLSGRIAFLIIDESGKLDPAALVSGDAGEPWIDINGNSTRDAWEFWDLVDGDSDVSTYEFTSGVLLEDWQVARMGAFSEEIHLTRALPASLQANRDWFRSQRPAVAGGRTRWFSWMHLFNGVGMSSAEAVECTTTLFPYSYDRDLYRSDGSDIARFNVFRGDWDTMAVAGLLAGLPGIGIMENKDGVSVGSQVAANLIDYCDTDYVATTDGYDPAAKTATYVGVENVPFINEVAVSIGLSDGADPASQRNLTVQANVELINMFGSGTSVGDADHPVVDVETIDLAVDIAYTDPAVGSEATFTRTFIWSNTSVPVASYAQTGFASSVEGDLVLTSVSDQLQDVKINAVRVAIGTGAVPIQATALYDCAVVGVNPGSAILIKNVPVYSSAEVNDPRQNSSGTGVYDYDNWKWLPFVTVLTDPQAPTLGAVNRHATATGGAGLPLRKIDIDGDPANGNEIWIDHEVGNPGPGVDISTAYIRNGPPKSLWELGAVHRGEPWRTVSLVQISSLASAGSYERGDWSLLDQACIVDPILDIVHGKVNINTPVQLVLEALLDGVTVGGGYNSPAPGGGSLIPAASLDNLAVALIGATNPASGAPFENRGAIGTVSALFDSTCSILQDTDRRREEIVGKIANLLTTRQNYFTIIVVAEAVQDIGAVAAPESAAVPLVGGGTTRIQVLASQKMIAVVYRDAFLNTYSF